MKKARTKKLRGGKRKLGAASGAAPRKSTESKPSAQTPLRTQEEKAPPVTPAPSKKSPVESEQAAREAGNVLKAKGAPGQSAPSPAGAGAEAERWISLIRGGGLDRKVKVKGKTGALLVR